MVISSIFAFLKKPRLLAIFLAFYFLVAVVDYEVFRFSHQRLSYSFLRTYFHISNITDSTTISTLGGDLKGTLLWLFLMLLSVGGAIAFVVYYTKQKKKLVQTLEKSSLKIPIVLGSVGLILSVIPLVLFLTGTRGIKTIPIINVHVDMRFTLGKHTLTSPILHMNLFQGLEIREDVASQMDIGPTVFDLAQVRASNHFWGYDLLVEKRPAEQPAVFFSQNAYYLGFRDFVLTGGLTTEDVYKGVNDHFTLAEDSLSLFWKKKVVGASKVLRSLLRNDNMQP